MKTRILSPFKVAKKHHDNCKHLCMVAVHDDDTVTMRFTYADGVKVEARITTSVLLEISNS